jgi:O-antigen/teichoic acid export membrane protein
MGFTGPQMPRMSELEGQGKDLELRQLFLRSTKGAAVFSLFIGSLLLVDGKEFLRLWLGERFVGSYGLLVALTIGYVPALAQWPSRNVLYAKGCHQPLGWWTLAEGAANLLLSVYWARKYGLLGVALGTTVPMLVVGLFIQPWYALRLIRIPLRQYAREALIRPLLGSGLFLAICSETTGWQGQARLGTFLLTLAWQGTLLALLCYSVVLTRAERQVALQRGRYLGGLAIRLYRTELQ